MANDWHDARAAIARAPHQPLSIERVRLEDPRADEVLVRVVATGLCHTDLVARDILYPVPQPIVLGHEGAGVVQKIGASVDHVAPGDHVVLSFSSCGECPPCKTGAPAYCSSLFSLCFGGARADGSQAICGGDDRRIHSHFFGQSSFSTLALAHQRNVVRVRSDAPLELLGPLGCGLQTGAGSVLNVLRPQQGQSLAIFGAGAVGLSALMAARIAQAAPLIVVDVIPSRLSMARQLGADIVIDARSDDPVAAIRAATSGGADFCLEATGRPAVIGQAIAALGSRGMCGIVGAAPMGATASFDINDVMVGGKQVRGIVEGDSIPAIFIPQLVDLFLDGRFPLDKLIRTYPFEAINDAIADAETGRVIKPVILFS